MRKASCIIALIALAASVTAVESGDTSEEGTAGAFRSGESFVFRIGWGLLAHAGETRITTAFDDSEDSPQYRVVTQTATRGLLRNFFPMQNQSESLIEASTGKVLASSVLGVAGTRNTHAETFLDYRTQEVIHLDHVNPEKNAVRDVPSGAPIDIAGGFLQTRTLDLKPGEQTTVLVQHGGEFYNVVVVALAHERVRTPVGSFDTVILQPRIDGGELLGFFRRGGEIKIWVSRDERRLPVKLEVRARIGTAVAMLSEYQPPSTRYADSRI